LKYSIIIPTLNEEKLLPKLLEQLTQKEIKEKYELEIIVSDSGSKDRTISIAESYNCKVIKFQNGDICNIAFGRYIGAKNSSGKILVFLNADIIIDNPIKMFSVIEGKFNQSNFVGMTCPIKVFPDSEKMVDKLFSYFMNHYVQLLNLLGIGMMRGECQIIKRSVYDEVGGYNFNLYAGEDFELSTRIRKNGKILFSKDFVIYESPRRYHTWGYLKIILSWFLNSISSWFLKKSFNKKWEEIR
jgi:glycosyltransferase involved in cell wall biosynthesis